jgi:acid phosphatase type 7
MYKRLIKRAFHLLSVLMLGGLLIGGNLLSAQAMPGQTGISALTTSSIFIPLVTTGSSTAAGGTDPVVLAAGDIAKCTNNGDAQTAAIINNISGTVLALGDNAYDSGTPTEYATCYDPTWGAFKSRTLPVPGNHDYLTTGASGYFGYFGALAGDPAKGYYSYNLGSWHILAINSNCVNVGGCNTNSPQETWVRADLAANPKKCVLAYWHHPYYTSGVEGITPRALQMAAIWTDLFNAGAEIVLSGHQHNYERFAPQDTNQSVRVNGVVQFVVGTGGGNFTALSSPLQPNSLTSLANTYGVLKLTLHPTSYTWQFIPVSGTYTDSGTANCH